MYFGVNKSMHSNPKGGIFLRSQNDAIFSHFLKPYHVQEGLHQFYQSSIVKFFYCFYLGHIC